MENNLKEEVKYQLANLGSISDVEYGHKLLSLIRLLDNNRVIILTDYVPLPLYPHFRTRIYVGKDDRFYMVSGEFTTRAIAMQKGLKEVVNYL